MFFQGWLEKFWLPVLNPHRIKLDYFIVLVDFSAIKFYVIRDQIISYYDYD